MSVLGGLLQLLGGHPQAATNNIQHTAPAAVFQTTSPGAQLQGSAPHLQQGVNSTALAGHLNMAQSPLSHLLQVQPQHAFQNNTPGWQNPQGQARAPLGDQGSYQMPQGSYQVPSVGEGYTGGGTLQGGPVDAQGLQGGYATRLYGR